MYWSVRRELWENRSIYIGPLVGAAVNMLAFLFNLMVLPRSLRELAAGDSTQLGDIVMPYGHATMLILLASFLVAVFYCLDALYGERRDRSILFWKSLPVSDLTTVLAKASIPLVVLPLIVFMVTVATHLTMLLLSSAVLLVSGGDVAHTVGTAAARSSGIDATVCVNCHGALVCANLWLAAAGLGQGAARGLSMGLVSADRDLRLRKDCIPHPVFRGTARIPFGRLVCPGFRGTRGSALYSAIPSRPAQISRDPGIVGWASGCGHVPGGCRAAAARSRANLSQTNKKSLQLF